MVGNCHWTSGQEFYVDELMKHKPLGIYGYCGKGLTCGRYRQLNESCVSSLLSHYKLYLAFENRFCDDHCRVYSIHVVMGLTNYTKLLTQGALIDVRDFTLPRALAKYLQYLIQNHTPYNECIDHCRRVSCHRKYPHSYMCELC